LYVSTLGGFSSISKNGQVAIPKSIRDRLNLTEGSQVLFRVSDDDPQVMQVIPAEVFESRYARGESISRLQRMSQSSDEPSADKDTTS
jgi:AbrB family looped-hinge helix DNA binding protein